MSQSRRERASRPNWAATKLSGAGFFEHKPDLSVTISGQLGKSKNRATADHVHGRSHCSTAQRRLGQDLGRFSGTEIGKKVSETEMRSNNYKFLTREC